MKINKGVFVKSKPAKGVITVSDSTQNHGVFAGSRPSKGG